MANYRIIITKVEPDPEFASKMEAYERNNRFGRDMYNQDPNRPQEKITSDVLICELTEEQFKKVKLEAIKAFQ